MTVLNWITNSAIRPIQYIRRKLNKVDGFENKFPKVQHHYAPSKINPVDITSRDLNLLRDSDERISLWLNGPPFLCYTYQWPPNPKFDNTTLDVMHPTCQPIDAAGASHIATTPQVTLMDNLIARHSALNVLCRVFAILTIFVEFMKICVEERIFSHHTDWNHQNYRTLRRSGSS